MLALVNRRRRVLRLAAAVVALVAVLGTAAQVMARWWGGVPVRIELSNPAIYQGQETTVTVDFDQAGWGSPGVMEIEYATNAANMINQDEWKNALVNPPLSFWSTNHSMSFKLKAGASLSKTYVIHIRARKSEGPTGDKVATLTVINSNPP